MVYAMMSCEIAIPMLNFCFGFESFRKDEKAPILMAPYEIRTSS